MTEYNEKLQELLEIVEKSIKVRDFRVKDGRLARKIIYRNLNTTEFEGTIYERSAIKLRNTIKVKLALEDKSIQHYSLIKIFYKELENQRQTALLNSFDALENHGIWLKFYKGLVKNEPLKVQINHPILRKKKGLPQ